MHKIANSSELQTEILHVLAMAQKPNPSRVEIATHLRKLAKNVLGANVNKTIERVYTHAIDVMKRDPKVLRDLRKVRNSTTTREWRVRMVNILLYWGLGPQDFMYKAYKNYFPFTPSEEAMAYIKGIGTAGVQKIVLSLLKRYWPESYEAATATSWHIPEESGPSFTRGDGSFLDQLIGIAEKTPREPLNWTAPH
jgi:hypothetical protein